MANRDAIDTIFNELVGGGRPIVEIAVTEQHIRDARTDRKGLAHTNPQLADPVSYAMYEATGFRWEWQKFMAKTGWFCGADMSQETPSVARDESVAQQIQAFLDVWDSGGNPEPITFTVTLQ